MKSFLEIKKVCNACSWLSEKIVFRITKQQNRKFCSFKASNGIIIKSVGSPAFNHITDTLYTRGVFKDKDALGVIVDEKNFIRIQQAIKEFNSPRLIKFIKTVVFKYTGFGCNNEYFKIGVIRETNLYIKGQNLDTGQKMIFLKRYIIGPISELKT